MKIEKILIIKEKYELDEKNLTRPRTRRRKLKDTNERNKIF